MLQLLSGYWISLTPKAKHQLNEILFPKGLVVQNSRVTTLELSPLFKDIEDISNEDIPSDTLGRTRTYNLFLRTELLYPIELLGQHPSIIARILQL